MEIIQNILFHFPRNYPEITKHMRPVCSYSIAQLSMAQRVVKGEDWKKWAGKSRSVDLERARLPCCFLWLIVPVPVRHDINLVSLLHAHEPLGIAAINLTPSISLSLPLFFVIKSPK